MPREPHPSESMPNREWKANIPLLHLLDCCDAILTYHNDPDRALDPAGGFDPPTIEEAIALLRRLENPSPEIPFSFDPNLDPPVFPEAEDPFDPQ